MFAAPPSGVVMTSLALMGFRCFAECFFVLEQEDGNCKEASEEHGGMVQRSTSGVRVHGDGERQ